jgi:glutamate/tyrosine decarboxylase-like PLP-dependent enzyme
VGVVQKNHHDEDAETTLDDEDEHARRIVQGALDMLGQQALRPPRSSFLSCKGEQKVVEFQTPEELWDRLFSSERGTLTLGDEGLRKRNNNNGKNDPTDLIRCFADVARYSVDTSHPLFLNQLFGTLDPVALAAELISLQLHTSNYTFETSPVFTLMERHCIDLLGQLVYGTLSTLTSSSTTPSPPSSTPTGGLFCPGGSISNLMGLHVARHHCLQALQKDERHHCPCQQQQEQNKQNESFHGCKECQDWMVVQKNRLVALVSEEAHYSFLKAMLVTGMGKENLVTVPTCPKDGSMDTQALQVLLEELEAEGRIPFFVGATSGSTVRGSFDDLAAICRVAKNRRQGTTTASRMEIWVHVDGAWGGAAIFSDRPDMKALLQGVQDVDSFTLNMHKLLGAPQQTTAWVTRHPHALAKAHSTKAKYLFDGRKHGAAWDLGDSTFTCGRKPDVIKFWALYKYHGRHGLAKRVEETADSILKIVVPTLQSHPNFLLACTPWPFNVNFYYIHSRLLPTFQAIDTNDTHNSPQISACLSDELTKVSVTLKLRLHEAGEVIIPFQPLSDQDAYCFRLVLAGNKTFDQSTMDHLLSTMHRYGADL